MALAQSQLIQSQVGPFRKYTFVKAIPGSKAGTSEVNVYRLGDTLFDSGSQPGAPYLVDALRDDPPGRILLTHQHEDHIGGLPALVAAFGPLPIFAPREHIEIIRDGYVVPEYRVAFWGEVGAFRDLEIAALDTLPASEWRAGGLEFRMIDTPGHTVGHKSFAVESEGRLFVLSGDLYLAPKLPNAFYETSVPDMIASLEALMALAPDFVLCPSHGGPFENGAQRVRQLLQWYESERDAILEVQARGPEGARDYNAIFKQRFGFYNPMEIASKGELSRCALIRGVIDPVRELPAAPIELDAELYAESKERLERRQAR